jgi:hypothetical protein
MSYDGYAHALPGGSKLPAGCLVYYADAGTDAQFSGVFVRQKPFRLVVRLVQASLHEVRKGFAVKTEPSPVEMTPGIRVGFIRLSLFSGFCFASEC